MNNFGDSIPDLHSKMQEDLLTLNALSNDYGPQSSHEAIEATHAALKDILFGISRNKTTEAELGLYNLASMIEEPAQFFGEGNYSCELVNLQPLKPETIALIMKALFMQLSASDNTK